MGSNRYHSPRRADAAAATRAAILAAGRELFMLDGYASTTVPQIARRARVAVPTVYSSAGGKAEILAALLEPLTNDPAVGESLAAATASTDGAEIIEHLGRGTYLTHERNWDIVVGLFPQSQSAPSTAELFEKILRMYQEAIGVVATRLDQVGALRPGLTRDDALDVLWFYLGAGAWPSLVRDRGWTLDRARDWLTEAAKSALLPPASQAT